MLYFWGPQILCEQFQFHEFQFRSGNVFVSSDLQILGKLRFFLYDHNKLGQKYTVHVEKSTRIVIVSKFPAAFQTYMYASLPDHVVS